MNQHCVQNTVLFGARGHAGVIVDAMEAAGLRLPVAIIDNDPVLAGSDVFGIPVIGGDTQFAKAILDYRLADFVMGIGSVGDSTIRQAVYRSAVARLRNAVTVIHPTAVVSRYATLLQGCQILPGAVVNRNAAIGENVIVNTGAIVEHDCRIASHVHIAPGAILVGNVEVGAGSHIGCGATVLQSVSIGCNSIVGAGAIVTADVADNTVVVGVPARTHQRQQAA
jgi:sugar O-acyltransferase (sialic acid O-acetyltransferase NeuD family)